MTLATPHHTYTYADYLALESASTVKHEYFRGEIYAMAGGTPEHAALAMALAGVLHPQLRDGPCRLYSSDLRVRVLASGLTTYPDVTVVCGPLERDPESAITVVNPRVLFEVLSDGPETYDLGEKFEHYKLAPSVQAVVFIALRERHVRVRTRGALDAWEERAYGAGQRIELPSIAARVDVDEVYRGVVA